MENEQQVLESSPMAETDEDIIRTQAEVEGKPMATLVRTYNELGFGKPIKKFETRAAAESRVTNALMLARDAHGHMGIPPNTEPRVMTLRERIQYAIDKRLPPERAEGEPERLAAIAQELGAEPALPAETFPEGSVARELAQAAEKTKGKPERKPRAAETRPRARRNATGGRVTARTDGTSKLHPDSERYGVWKFIAEGENGTRTFEEMEAKYGKQFRGHLQKLAFKDHVTIVIPAEGEAPAAAAAAE